MEFEKRLESMDTRVTRVDERLTRVESDFQVLRMTGVVGLRVLALLGKAFR